MSRVYLYGIIATEEPTNPTITGVDGISPVYIADHRGLGGVVSDYQGGELEALPKDQLVQHLLRHQQVIEKVMAMGHTVLPIRFGTSLGDREDLLSLLAQGQQRLAHELALLQDRIEMEVAVTWDVDQVLQQIAREEEIAGARDNLTARGQLTLADQINLGRIVKERLDQRRQVYQDRVLNSLSALAVDLVSNALLSDAMVANAAFLLHRDRQRQFDLKVRQLDHLFAEEGLLEFNFRVIGPLPPYSFNTLEITPVSAERVEAAKQALCLEEVVSEAQVKQAFRRLAARDQSHDRSVNGLDETRIVRRRQAADLLTAYLRSNSTAPERCEKPGLPRRREKTFLISTRRSESSPIPAAPRGVPLAGRA